eukprot:CAMPEP_0172441902 /NCGR_PEP_ID=MMETSP1065-20121228/2416_1 /TAXON_ID=265537 /ORGANISM="Amphiprora paludosa, Strain CCMP125" /LENGTH=678 /DNA_ID=CAMNT_0013191517 /DNA_START=99 /DNA_END=2132 /DNA_ORIENTATION=-
MVAAAPPVLFPRLALEWIVRHSVASDVELAQLSNVSTTWRNVVIQVVQIISSQRLDDPSFNPLLLTSFARQLALQPGDNNQGMMVNDAFCVAWFAPEGLQQTWVSRHEGGDDEDDNGSSSSEGIDAVDAANSSLSPSNTPTSAKSEPFAPNGVVGYSPTHEEPSDGEKRRRSNGRSLNSSINNAKVNSRRSRSSNSFVSQQQSSDHILVAEEWRGLQSPFQVFGQFGYTQAFLEALLQSLPATPERDALLTGDLPAHETNAVVRGATVARPEAYCLCYDVDKKEEEKELERAIAIRTEERGVDCDQEMVQILKREYKQALRRKARRRKELRRETMPRILVSGARGHDNQAPCPPTSVQFLNGPGEHAVCMVTPLFDCGPLPTPLTIFCVGIATEDGCFLSGLGHRFEFGHLYPANDICETTELSPICIATESWEPDTGVQVEDIPDRRPPGLTVPTASSVDDSSVEHSEDDFESTVSCHCKFHGVGEKRAQIETDPERIHRGRLGPGSWHCYTAICDGPNCRIRVDGIEEPVEVNIATAANHSSMLDGLTIGSDHCFGLSLCCGQGPGGDGAIAEVAIFHGCLGQSDIQMLERRLMKKHRIPKPGPDFVEANEMERRAQNLYCQGMGYKDASAADETIPLRYLAQHRNVAWKQHDPVTGQSRRIEKIGARRSTGSSDW